MEVKELGHLVLYVRNLERSATFYRDVLGWRQLAPTDDLGFPAAAFSAPSNRTHHELLLIEVGPGHDVYCHRICWQSVSGAKPEACRA